MQQYNVPQFVEAEDKIIGPLTLRQFFALLAGGIVVAVIWSVFQYSVVFWLLAVPVALLTIFIALANVNGRPVLAHVFPFLGFVSTPKRRLFKREDVEVVITKKTAEVQQPVKPQDVQNRLKRLSYILDQKAMAQKQLLEEAKNLNSNT